MNFKELERRIQFCNEQIDVLFKRIHQFEKAVKTHEDDLMMASRCMDDFDVKIRELKSLSRTESRRKMKAKFQMIERNLQSVTRQLKEREPTPWIPEDQMEAMHEFLIKLNGSRPKT